MIIQQALTNLTLYGMTSIGLDCNHNMSSLSRSHRQKAAIHIVLTQINDGLLKITKKSIQVQSFDKNSAEMKKTPGFLTSIFSKSLSASFSLSQVL